MNGKIALEEHFGIEETLGSPGGLPSSGWAEMKSHLLDIHSRRIGVMDQCGIEMMILSLNAPGVQAVLDARQAADLARRANDVLADQVARRPDRFQAFAALPMQDPDFAIQELHRCVNECGFRGALVNGFSQVGVEDSVVYLDLPQYRPFWKAVEELNVPFYLHPRDPLPSRAHHYEGHPWFLGPVWAFAVETSIQALRLMGSGLFDEHPRLQIILGHMGEGLPYGIWRVDHRLQKSPRGIPARKPLSEYLHSNFYLTTSGNFRTQTLLSAMLEVGADRLLFSTDYPFEEASEASDWFDQASISEPDRLKIGRLNAIRLFNLGDAP